MKSPLLCPGGGRSREAAHSTCLFYLAVNFHALDCLEFRLTRRGGGRGKKKKGMQIMAERSVNMFRQHARRRTTQTAPESGHHSRDGQLRCHGWGVVTWKFTEPVYESGGLWCNCEACCVLRACPFWCQRSKYLSSEFMACVHFSSRAFFTGKFQPRRVRAPTTGWNKSAIQILSKIDLIKSCSAFLLLW